MAPGIGDTLRGLFGGKGQGAAKPASEAPVAYKGYMIRPAPQKEGSQWLTAGYITKQFGDTVKEHHFIRSDIYASRDSAADFSVTKGQQIVDLEGDRIFE
jgi:hypothetical protein